MNRSLSWCRWGVIAGLRVVGACEARPDSFEILAEGQTLSKDERSALQDVADRASRDVRALLPRLPSKVTLVVQRGKDVIPETGETATAVPPDRVVWTVDPDRNLLSIVRKELRFTLFHELYHLVRDPKMGRASLLDSVVAEGLATAFERDFGKANPPWGIAPPEIAEWTREVLRQPADAPPATWLFRHPDGRRWIGMEVGTYLVDLAMRESGRSSVELVVLPTDEVLQLARIEAKDAF